MVKQVAAGNVVGYLMPVHRCTAAGEPLELLQDVYTKIQCLKRVRAPVRFRKGEFALCPDRGVGLCQAGFGFVFVLRM